jgi:hypothetical protein
MKEHPILFSAPMVRAILEGRKTQTRRVIKPQPERDCGEIYGPETYSPLVVDKNGEELPGPDIFGIYTEDWGLKFPYGQPGDHLWVKETYKLAGSMYYRADGEPSREDLELYPNWKWKPSIFMPRVFSRILLEIKAVEVQRLDQITIDDINGEGCPPISTDEDGSELYEWYSDLWDSLNKKSGFGWDKNPWIWVIRFNRIEMPVPITESE